MREMTIATASQWALLGGYIALLLWSAFVAGWLPRLRSVAWAAGSIALSHVVYYALFLIFPDVLGGPATMHFSIALRFQVLFTAALLLALAVKREQTK